MMIKLLLKTTLTLFVLIGVAFAADLTTAKNSGLLGEQSNGYLGLVSKAPADVIQLAKDVNHKRRAIYIQLAKKKNVSLKNIENVAGTRNMGKTAKGLYIKDGKGWHKK